MNWFHCHDHISEVSVTVISAISVPFLWLWCLENVQRKFYYDTTFQMDFRISRLEYGGHRTSWCSSNTPIIKILESSHHIYYTTLDRHGSKLELVWLAKACGCNAGNLVLFFIWPWCWNPYKKFSRVSQERRLVLVKHHKSCVYQNLTNVVNHRTDILSTDSGSWKEIRLSVAALVARGTVGGQGNQSLMDSHQGVAWLPSPQISPHWQGKKCKIEDVIHLKVIRVNVGYLLWIISALAAFGLSLSLLALLDRYIKSERVEVVCLCTWECVSA